MGIVRTAETRKTELEELRRLALWCAGEHKRIKTEELEAQEGRDHEEQIEDCDEPEAVEEDEEGGEEENEEEEERVVCVTSGISYLGLAIVHRLLSSGYSVRVAVDNEEDVEKVREMEIFGGRVNGVSAVTAKVDGRGKLVSGLRWLSRRISHLSFRRPRRRLWLHYLEVKASENVLEACARTESIRKCVFTSSLLACIWRNNTLHDIPLVLDHNCWSEESVCREKKLWFALGKTLAEKAAWRVAEKRDVKLVSICPGLVTGPDFCRRNPTATIAYLKGMREMYAEGLLATSDVAGVADAHVRVYKAMRNRASGRYICYNRVIKREEEALMLARQLGMPFNRILGDTPSDSTARFKLCDKKLSRLVSRPTRCSLDRVQVTDVTASP